MDFLSPRFLVVYVFVACACHVQLRGRQRYGFWRQLTNYSTFLAPYSTLMYLFSRVPTRPRVDLSHFPQLAPLREHWRVIRAEVEELLQRGSIRRSEGSEDVAFNSFFKRGWKRFYLKWYDDVLPTARELCPRTVELVESLPCINAAMFALLPARSHLPRHRDPFAGSLRYHLGLVTPNSDDCRIFIDGVPYSWRDGEAIVFDETYLHRAENNTDLDRIILFCDVDRPLYTPVVRAVNSVAKRLARLTSSRNEEFEKIGAVNRIAGPLYRVRGKIKELKRKHRGLYFGLAYAFRGAFLAAVLAWLFLGRGGGPVSARQAPEAAAPPPATAPGTAAPPR